jgi:WD40 repeat protein
VTSRRGPYQREDTIVTWLPDYEDVLLVSFWSSKIADDLANEDQDPPGPTFFSYTPNGQKLITAGGNGALRVFEHLSTDEPAIIDVSTEDHLALAARNDFFVVGSEDGSVTKYSLATNSMDEVLVRCSLPVRDVALSPDGQWCAVASECV